MMRPRKGWCRVLGCAIAITSVVAMGCGDGEEETPANAETNNNNANATLNGATNLGTHGVTSGGDAGAWAARVDGESQTLGPISGMTFTASRVENRLQIGGTDGAASLAISVVVGEGDVALQEYGPPSQFELEFGDEGFECLAQTDVRVAITDVEPFAGTFSGTVTCENAADMTMNFDGALGGEFIALPE